MHRKLDTEGNGINYMIVEMYLHAKGGVEIFVGFR